MSDFLYPFAQTLDICSLVKPEPLANVSVLFPNTFMRSSTLRIPGSPIV
ncbi:MAG: hypothetical protein ACE5SW_05175 [Nitrososphaeraceae archaeon]